MTKEKLFFIKKQIKFSYDHFSEPFNTKDHNS